MAGPMPLEDIMVNDRYWLGLARTILSAGVTRRDQAADKLATTIGWLWTAYSAAAIVGVAFSGRRLSPLLIAVIVAPAGLLIIAYLFAMRAMMPVGVEFDVRDVTAIEDQHVKAMGDKAGRLRWATWLTVIAGIGVLIAIVATAFASPVVERSFHATAVNDGGQVRVVYNGAFAANQAVTIKVTSLDPTIAATYQVDVASPSGELNGTMLVPVSEKGYRVTVSWTEDKVDHSTTLSVDPPT